MTAPSIGAVEDGSQEIKLARSRLARAIYAGLGLLCVGLAIIGLFLPGWPTTIWLLIAAWLFSRSSPRFYNLILSHRVFGPIVRDYRAGNGVPRRIKFIAISSIVLFAGSSAWLLIYDQWVRLAVVGVAMLGVGFMLGLPTRRPYELQQVSHGVAPGLMTDDSVAR